jgi:hypothetical protein
LALSPADTAEVIEPTRTRSVSVAPLAVTAGCLGGPPTGRSLGEFDPDVDRDATNVTVHERTYERSLSTMNVRNERTT